MTTAIHKVNLAYAYACAVKAHQEFGENHSCIKGATIDFELIQGVRWHLQGENRNGYIGYTENPEITDPEDFDYGYEVNWVVHQDDNCIHVDADDGCGNRHLQLVFLKSEEIKDDSV